MSESSKRIDPIQILIEKIIKEVTNVSREYDITLAAIVGVLEFIKSDLINGDFGKPLDHTFFEGAFDEDDEEDDDDDEGEEWKHK